MTVILFEKQLLEDAVKLRIQMESHWIRVATLLNDNEFIQELRHRNIGWELSENKDRI